MGTSIRFVSRRYRRSNRLQPSARHLLDFALAPAGQDYFKQSNTYLHLVSTKVLTMALDLYRDPVRMVDSISGVGLHHVGYGTPNIPHVSVPLQTANLSLHRCSRGGWTGIRTQVVGQRHPSVGLRRVGCASPAELLPVLLCNRRGDSQLLVR